MQTAPHLHRKRRSWIFRFFATMKAGLLLCVAAALFTVTVAQAPAPSPSLTTEVLNFALNLEYLEAEFYSCAATGQPLPADLRGGGPASTGCEKAILDAKTQAIAEELADNEIAHVTLLRTALGAEAVPIPQLNIGSAFAAAADAAAGMTLTPTFSPYLNSLFFLHGAFIFEDVGVTAYAGAAPLIATSSYLGDAARILAVEAYHAGIIRDELYQSIDVVTPYNITVGDLIDAIAALRNKVGAGSAEGLESTSGALTLVPTDAMGLVYTRTPAEVIAIVTLGASNGRGGFFPDGLNGALGAASQTATGG
ncbi:hypothetical protein WJX73_000941 [Symbiochloris irregularis]|uniref:Desiccation-related protein PCC13-62 n=1 Tax=Symbiochloris irregularis TaxID=706552 RepID=A0AAW1P4N3_9CHLO